MDIAAKAKQWATSPVFDDATRKEVQDLIDRDAGTELTDRFYRDLEFGTGGLRGIIGAGTARMNIYNVRKASFAFAQYLKDTFAGEPLKMAIGFDSRRFSDTFSKAAAEVYAAQGITVYLMRRCLPVPMLSYLVRSKGCHGGICVTASHNPPEYNGYKVYWQTGGQIVPPHDQEIISRYQNQQSYGDIPTKPFADALSAGKIIMVGEEFENDYFAQVTALSLSSEGKDELTVAYSPIHGTGAYPVTTVLNRLGIAKVHLVAEQKEPDGDFPTVKSPNPEDPPAFKQVLALAKDVGADLAMATDPDVDRIGIAVKTKDDYVLLNGNQIAALLTEFILSRLKATGKLPAEALMIKTIVTSHLLDDIAKHYGVASHDTLTGFKWIADWIERLEQGELKPYQKFICGGEESYGFLMASFVRDKDAVIACGIAAEMVAYYKAQGQTLVDVLDTLYLRHGAYAESLKTFKLPGKEGAEQIQTLMKELRDNPPSQVAGVNIAKIHDIADLSIKVRNSGTSNGGGESFCRAGTIDLPRSNVLQFFLEDGSKISVRPSGTEPKIKLYFSLKQAVSEDSAAASREAQRQAQKRLSALEAELVQMIEAKIT